MFVRWQNYKSVAHWNWQAPRNAWTPQPVIRCKAILVESVRVNGKPRLKHIAFIASYQSPEARRVWNAKTHFQLGILGSPEVENTDMTSCHVIPDRFRFWRTARERLDRLSNQITSEDRIKIEAALALRVLPTTLEEVDVFEREAAENDQWFKDNCRQ
jgi:hypothetical protein